MNNERVLATGVLSQSNPSDLNLAVLIVGDDGNADRRLVLGSFAAVLREECWTSKHSEWEKLFF